VGSERERKIVAACNRLCISVCVVVCCSACCSALLQCVLQCVVAVCVAVCPKAQGASSREATSWAVSESRR